VRKLHADGYDVADNLLAAWAGVGFWPVSGTKILDFGCGSGQLTYRLRDLGFDAYGFDLHERVAYRQPVDKRYFGFSEGATCDTSDTTFDKRELGVPFPDDMFDIVVSTSVLEHVFELDPVMSEIARVLKPEGFAYHLYPSKWVFVEPHMYVPLGSLVQGWRYFWLWALLGVRNDFQKGMTASEVANANARYCTTGLKYRSKKELRQCAARYFKGVRFVDELYYPDVRWKVFWTNKMRALREPQVLRALSQTLKMRSLVTVNKKPLNRGEGKKRRATTGRVRGRTAAAGSRDRGVLTRWRRGLVRRLIGNLARWLRTAPPRLETPLPPLEAPSEPVPSDTSSPRTDDEQRLDLVRQSLIESFFNGNTEFLATEEGRADLENHLIRRLECDRTVTVPWLNRARSLRGLHVLEIGCGTGSSTVALAEQGASVVAVDVLPSSLNIARVRCAAYGLDDVAFHVANAADLPPEIAGQRFDFIIFFASLEHMLHAERLKAMALTWSMLPPGGLWCITDTPNRLWYTDGHTSLMPFFQWLPDDLALKYSAFSPRPSVRDHLRTGDDDEMMRFLRFGRGVSFHEFELGLAPLDRLNVVSCQAAWRIEHVRAANGYEELSTANRYLKLMIEIAPTVPPAFFLPSLDLIIEKPGGP